MSSFNANLSRYRLPKDHSCGGCVLPKGTVEDGVHLLMRLHPGRGASKILSEYQHLRELTGDICPHNLRKVLKESTGWLKLGGRYVSKYWRLLTYWETMTGYVPPVKISQLKGDVDD